MDGKTKDVDAPEEVNAPEEATTAAEDAPRRRRRVA
jgi:hypothetical protein